ncbi:MAG: phosphotransferase [Pseudomonadota bacterium]
MSDAQLVEAVVEGAAAWGGLATAPRLLSRGTRTRFDITLTSGERALFRLHPQIGNTAQAVETEMLWCESLADTGFACPWPLRTKEGALVVALAERSLVASALLWLDGAPAGAPPGQRQASVAYFTELGTLLADLHLTSDAVAPEDIARPAWDTEALCSAEAPAWGRFWENPALSPEEAELLCAARDAARRRLDAGGTADIGLIHADVLQRNVLSQDDQLYLVDFDNGSRGFRMYDLATALEQHVGLPEFDILMGALIDGYLAGGGQVSEADRQTLPMFVMLRAMASAGRIMSAAPPDDPRCARHAGRAVHCAREFLAA